MLLSLKTRIAAVLCCCAAAAGVAALATRHASATAPDPRAGFAVLSAAADSDDASLFSLGAARDLAAQRPDAAPDLASARTRTSDVQGAAEQQAISVATTVGGHLCLAHRATGASSPLFITCASFDAVSRDGLVNVSHIAPGRDVDPRTTNVTALLPDGVDKATFQLADGTERTIAVVDNTFTAQLEAPSTMSFTSAAGTSTINLEGEGAR
jgi:hypothetical protein